MEAVCGRLNLGSSENITKASVRQKVWEFMEKNDIANFPRPVYHRIPNFKGAQAAGQQVATLPEFQSARTVKVSPDRPQDEVRYLVLEHNKDLIVPTPGLSKGLFNRLSAEPGSSKERIRQLASRQGIDELSKPVPMASRLKVDLVVVGSVAVDFSGRRIGKGEGFSDLEFAMAASHHQAVGPETVVVTTVHDVQVFEDQLLPERLFASHDLTVDIIVTPTRIIRIDNRLPKPEGIIWNILTREKFDKIPILKEIQYREKKNGKVVHLKDEPAQNVNGNKEFSNGKSEVVKKVTQNNRKLKSVKNLGQDPDGITTELNGAPTAEVVNRPIPKPQAPTSKKHENQMNIRQQHHENRSKQQQHNRDHDNHRQHQQERDNETRQHQQQQRQPKQDQQQKDRNDINRKQPPQQHKQQQERGSSSNSKKSGNQFGNNVGIFIGRIPRTARVKDLKDVLGERDVKVVNLVWKGMKGFAFVYLELEPGCSEDSLCCKLQGLKIGEALLNVELDRKHHGQKQGAKSVSPDNEVDISGDQIPKFETNGNTNTTLPEPLNEDERVANIEDKHTMSEISDDAKKSVDHVKLGEPHEAPRDEPNDQLKQSGSKNSKSNFTEDSPPLSLQTESDNKKSESLIDKSLSGKPEEKAFTEQPKIEVKLDLVSENVKNQDGSPVKVEHTLCPEKLKFVEAKADNGKVLDNKVEEKEEHILRQDESVSVVVDTEVKSGKVSKEEHILPVTSLGEPAVAEE